MAGKGGGAWKVAYADFVTAMMAFFLVMWITSQNDEVKKAIGGYFQDPWGTSHENVTPSMTSPTGLKGDAPFADVPTGILPERWPQANRRTPRRRRPAPPRCGSKSRRFICLPTTTATCRPWS